MNVIRSVGLWLVIDYSLATEHVVSHSDSPLTCHIWFENTKTASVKMLISMLENEIYQTSVWFHDGSDGVCLWPSWTEHIPASSAADWLCGRSGRTTMPQISAKFSCCGYPRLCHTRLLYKRYDGRIPRVDRRLVLPLVHPAGVLAPSAMTSVLHKESKFISGCLPTTHCPAD